MHKYTYYLDVRFVETIYIDNNKKSFQQYNPRSVIPNDIKQVITIAIINLTPAIESYKSKYRILSVHGVHALSHCSLITTFTYSHQAAVFSILSCLFRGDVCLVAALLRYQ